MVVSFLFLLLKNILISFRDTLMLLVPLIYRNRNRLDTYIKKKKHSSLTEPI